MRALVVKPHRLSATGFVGEALGARGIELVEHVASEDGPPPGLDGFDLMLVMGAPWSVYGPEVEPWIEGVLETLRRAVRRDVPVLGVCFGAQALAAALGAEVRRAEADELGWREVSTEDPELVAAGPWFLWHSDTFDLPPGAREIARTERGDPQAYVLGPHVCVQFHPEADVTIVRAWMDHDDSDFVNAGLSPGAVLEETGLREAEARDRADALVGGFLKRAGVPSGR